MGKEKEWQPTHTGKVYWPVEGYTKGDLIEYYGKISKILLPYLKDRPMVMKRYPEGIDGGSFFQKNFIRKNAPKFLKTVTVPAKTIKKNVHYIICNDQETLLYMVNLGAIELHPFDSRIEHLSKPDLMIFDFDPGEKIAFDDVIEAAHILKEILDRCGMTSYVKTSGRRGLHIYVPIEARYTYKHVRGFAHRIAQVVVKRHPKLASLAKHSIDRKNKIFVDYLRNSFGQTAIAPYCVRATRGATVSTPLAWDEVRKGLDPKVFTMITIFDWLKKKKDVWHNMFEYRNDLVEAEKLLRQQFEGDESFVVP